MHRRTRTAASLVTAALAVTTSVLADEALPPWVDSGDLPLPVWARSVTPNRSESAIYSEPGRTAARRGSAQPGARLPLFATRRASGCQGRWLAVGPFAWMCSDVADFSPEPPGAPPLGTRPWSPLGLDGAPVGDFARPSRAGALTTLAPIEPLGTNDDGLPYRYFFAGRDGASGFPSLENALDDAPDQDLEPGFAVVIVEERTAHGERWGRTKKGRWVAMRELVPARPNLFHGQLLEGDGALDRAWVTSDKANVYAADKPGKPAGLRVRFEPVRVYEERPGKDGGMVRVSADSDSPAWLRARDVARPRAAAPPPVVNVEAGERWIDVELASQTLIAYAGARPVFATIVSTGKGPPGSELATRPGTFRIWVKVFTTKMDNLDNEDVERHYAIEDVPWVQFFDKAIALHGAFWHHDFGRVHSHGCVNLAPLDARWLFAFTAPHLPAGWTAVLPTRIEQGTVIRVR
jgi:lipoprotein-anchoring transpeptidase ErfK/SrfK